MTRDEFFELFYQAESLPYSKAASQLWAEAALAAAEDEDLRTELVQCLIELQNSYRTADEVTRVVAPFLQCQQLFRDHPEAFTSELMQRFAWCYRYAIEAMWAVPEVPLDRIRQTLDEAHEYYCYLGDSRRSLFQLEYSYAWRVGDTEACETAYRNWLNAEYTEISNCAACDPEYEVRYLMDHKRYAEATDRGLAAIHDEGQTCASQPHSMHTELLDAYIRTNRFDEAWNAHLRAIRHVYSAGFMRTMLPSHLEALVQLAVNGRPSCAAKALELFVRFAPNIADAESPDHLFDIVRSGAAVCAVQNPDSIVPITLAGADIPWVAAVTIENPTAAEAYRWCYNIALGLAERFDNRPGNPSTHARERLESVLTGLSAPEASDTLADVSGIFLPSAEEQDEDAPYPPLDDVRMAADWDNDALRLAHESTGREVSSYIIRLAERGEEVDLTETYPEFAEAARLLEQRDFMAAAESVDMVLRADHDQDPVGVRLAGLELLAEAATLAGYRTEAIATLRELLNIAAAAALPSVQLGAAVKAARLLKAERRIDEACNVLYGALLAAESLHGHGELIDEVRHTYVQVLLLEDNFLPAAQQELMLADHLGGVERVSLLIDAATHHRKDFDFASCYQIFEQAIAYADSLDDKDTQAAVREAYCWAIAAHPWPGTDDEVALVRKLLGERQELLLSAVEAGNEANRHIRIADCQETLAYTLHHLSHFDLVDEPLERAVQEFEAAGRTGSAINCYLWLVEARLNWIEGSNAELPNLDQMRGWLEHAKLKMEALDHRDASLQHRLTMLEQRMQ